jgi:hypothetical protein
MCMRLIISQSHILRVLVMQRKKNSIRVPASEQYETIFICILHFPFWYMVEPNQQIKSF